MATVLGVFVGGEGEVEGVGVTFFKSLSPRWPGG
jgi:hypothetical protein